MMPAEIEHRTIRRLNFKRIFLVFFFIILAAAGGFVYYIYVNLQPVSGQGDPVRVEIPKGAPGTTIGQILQKAGIIRNANVFRYYAKYKGVSGKFQAGVYLFSPSMTFDEIIAKLVNGDVYVETVKFTIPEGFTVEQIADALARQGLINKQIFLRLVNEGNFDYDFVKEIPKNKNMKYRLEGYLFPNTYEIEKGSSEYDIINRMLAEFERQLKPEWIEAFRKKGLSLHEGLTLASIIERETIVEKELPIVAGVFYNRLAKGWRLESDATVQYASGQWRNRLYFKDLEIVDPYNTFITKGLPPGPISNPGSKALEAAAYPEEHDYYFFVTKKDGSNEHYFTKTFEEHQAKDRESRSNQ